MKTAAYYHVSRANRMDVRREVSGVRPQVSGVSYQASGIRRQVSVSALRYEESPIGVDRFGLKRFRSFWRYLIPDT
jgi:hypothetical protein